MVLTQAPLLALAPAGNLGRHEWDDDRMMTRRDVGGLAVGFVAVGTPLSARPSQPSKPALVTQTFVKALPNRRDQLARFLELNWLAMDRRGIDAGIFTHADLFDIVDASGDAAAVSADFVVEVGYLTKAGYRDVEAKFNVIRQLHKTVLVDGLGLRELGRVTGDRQLRPRASA
jgi:hypothetical protein